MYSSLDKIDIVAKDRSDGLESYHQTDHRRADEIAAEPELSTLLALARVVNARRMARKSDARVVYVCFESPPSFLHQAIAAAGGELLVTPSDAPAPFAGAPESPDDLADAAFRSLAQRVQGRVGAAGEVLLAELEEEITAEPIDKEEDEISHWTRVVELAAVAGELLRERTGGRWILDPDPHSIVPFIFEAGATRLNACGKAEKLLARGASESLFQLLAASADAHLDVTTAPLLVTFKPADWEGRSECVCRPLLANGERIGVDMPLVAVGHDQPHTFAMHRASPDEDVDALFGRAIANLAAVEVPVEEITVEDLRLLVASGSYFACEKILDEGFARRCQARLGASLLAVGLPSKGLLLMTSAVAPASVLGKFLAVCEGRYLAAEERNRLTKVPLLVQDGKLLGLLQAGAAEDDPGGMPGAGRRGGFFSRLIGRA